MGGTGPVVIFTDEPGWHGAALVRGLTARGMPVVQASLMDCAVDFSAGSSGLVIPGCAGDLPRGAFVRGVPGGSLEAITLRLDVLHRLAAFGCPVFNDARTIERTVDKAMTSLLLHAHGIPTPATFVTENAQQARSFAARELGRGVTLVKKPLFGSQGKGLERVRQLSDLGFLLPGEVVYLQVFVGSDLPPHRDCRVMVVDGRACAAMERESTHWITNRARGARCLPLPLAQAPVELAEAATRAIGAAYAGVDLMRDGDGRWLVTEVNGIPAWQGLQHATGIDIGEYLVTAFTRRIAAAAGHGG